MPRLSPARREHRDEWIRLLRDCGCSLRAIAGMLGCSSETVREALDPELKARRNAERAAHNTSPEGLARQRDYRARRLDQGDQST